MADPLPSPAKEPTTILDLDMDSMAHITGYLSVKEVSNLAMSSKFLKNVVYSDNIWQTFYRARWPFPMPHRFSQETNFRNSYLIMHTYTQQLKFEDPLIASFNHSLKPLDRLLLLGDDLLFSEGPVIRMLNGFNSGGCGSSLTLAGHHAAITCMSLYSLGDVPVTANSVQNGSAILTTSSCDHTIRLWSKGSCYQCFRGHNGEVTTLSDKTLGDGLFASGGVDGTVRLWSINSKGNKGKHALKGTLYGHEKPLIHMAVAAHKSSLLVSVSKDSKMRVWDTTCSSARSCCVGMSNFRGAGAPVGMKCHESLVYVAAVSSVIVTDLRTMREVLKFQNPTDLHSFDVVPSKSLIGMGRTGRVTLCDVRKSSDTFKAVPVAEMDEAHVGPVKHLHADAYKVVTGGPKDSNVKVWESDTGVLANSISCGRNLEAAFGCSAVATKGSKIVIAGTNGSLLYMDFENATFPASCESSSPFSKFWGSNSGSDGSDSSYESDDSDELHEHHPPFFMYG